MNKTNKGKLFKIRNRNIYIGPPNQYVSLVEFEDGSAEIFLDLDDKLVEKLEDNCKKRGLTFDELFRELMIDYLNDEKLDK